MAVTIRLKRAGSKKRPFYHIVVTDSRVRRDSKAIEKLGTFDPSDKSESGLNVNKERVQEWLKQGVMTSSTVKGLLSKAGIANSIA